ncbi:type II toxin-antitoxin system death-on-curing family toxin [Candidatus Obscuribacterales bacterium]|nr:type II toxin-antitoxin system death-on-curing family toxin [Candidatus Obscuribacterales bacterium]
MPRFLDLADVLEIHESRINLYGGSHGLRDLGLLQSALAQPEAGFGGELIHKDLFEMAAAYLFHISRNHAFVDGNNRTALACCLLFLSINDVEIEADPLELEELTLATVEGHMEKSDIADVLRAHHNSDS